MENYYNDNEMDLLIAEDDIFYLEVEIRAMERERRIYNQKPGWSSEIVARVTQLDKKIAENRQEIAGIREWLERQKKAQDNSANLLAQEAGE